MGTLRSRLPRFSLRWLLVGVVILSVGLAAATSASRGWVLGLALTFHLLLPLSIVLALCFWGERKAFWVGVGVFNLWSHLALGGGEYLIGERRRSEIVSLLETWVAAPLVRLQQDQVASLADQRVQAETAAMGAAAAHLSPADLSRAKAEFSRRIETERREAVTASLMYLLMILGSFTFGWLACWAYGRRDPGLPPTVQTQGEKS